MIKLLLNKFTSAINWIRSIKSWQRKIIYVFVSCYVKRSCRYSLVQRNFLISSSSCTISEHLSIYKAVYSKLLIAWFIVYLAIFKILGKRLNVFQTGIGIRHKVLSKDLLLILYKKLVPIAMLFISYLFCYNVIYL